MAVAELDLGPTAWDVELCFALARGVKEHPLSQPNCTSDFENRAEFFYPGESFRSLEILFSENDTANAKAVSLTTRNGTVEVYSVDFPMNGPLLYLFTLEVPDEISV